MTRRIKSLETVRRLQNCNLELARSNHVRATALLDKSEAHLRAMGDAIAAVETSLRQRLDAGEVVPMDEWQRTHEHLAVQARALGEVTAQVEKLRGLTAQAHDIMSFQSRSLRVTERLKERAEFEEAREQGRRAEKALDELWLLGEEYRQ